MSRPLRVLFVHARLWPYVEKDLRILQERYEVREVLFRGAHRSLPEIIQGVRWADIAFCWFAKIPAFFAVLAAHAAGKRSIVVTGGDDVARRIINGYRYGLCSHPLKRWFPQITCRLADRLLAVSDSNRTEAIENVGLAPEKVIVVYHGFDPAYYQRVDQSPKDGSISTVIAQINRENWFIKRPDLFVQAARYLPETTFKVIGPEEDRAWGERVRTLAPPHVQFVGPRWERDYVRELARTSVLAQPSEWESFGSSVAEGMLCECVLVVTRAASLPEVVGDCGVYVEERTPQAVARAIAEALQRPELGPRARQHIVDCFPLEKRRRALLETVDSLCRP